MVDREQRLDRSAEAREYAEFLAWRRDGGGARGAPLKRLGVGRQDLGVYNNNNNGGGGGGDGGDDDDDNDGFELGYSVFSGRGLYGPFGGAGPYE